MRIALLTDGIWPFVIGGMQKHSFYLCKFLARNKIHIDLYHTAPVLSDIRLAEHFTSEELNYINSYQLEMPPSDSFPGHYLRRSYKYSEVVYNALLKNDPADLIYAKGLTAWCLLKKRKRQPEMNLPPVCVNVHGYEYYQKSASLKSAFEQLMLRPAFKFINENADYIYSYGGKITGIINRFIRKRKGSVIEIPTGIEESFVVEQVFAVNTTRQFVYLGRNERRKGIDELLNVIGSLKNENFHFHFIGDIPASNNFSRKVTFHGLMNGSAEIKNILRNCDVLVCPSYAEGMPNVILEGMASGCAVISTDVGAVSEMVDDNNGWLISPGSTAALRRAVLSAVQIPAEELIKKKLYSVERIKSDFLWNNIIFRLIESFNTILKR